MKTLWFGRSLGTALLVLCVLVSCNIPAPQDNQVKGQVVEEPPANAKPLRWHLPFARSYLQVNASQAFPDQDALIAYFRKGIFRVTTKHGEGSSFAVARVPTDEQHWVYLISSWHVVQPAVNSGVKVVSPSYREYDAEIIDFDVQKDLVLLAAAMAPEADDFVCLPLAAKVPTETTAIIAGGFPFGRSIVGGNGSRVRPTFTRGAVSALRFKDDREQVLETVQVDADLNPGNSGGPVINAKGEVIGIVKSGVATTDISLLVPTQGFLSVLYHQSWARERLQALAFKGYEFDYPNLKATDSCVGMMRLPGEQYEAEYSGNQFLCVLSRLHYNDFFLSVMERDNPGATLTSRRLTLRSKNPVFAAGKNRAYIIDPVVGELQVYQLPRLNLIKREKFVLAHRIVAAVIGRNQSDTLLVVARHGNEDFRLHQVSLEKPSRKFANGVRLPAFFGAWEKQKWLDRAALDGQRFCFWAKDAPGLLYVARKNGRLSFSHSREETHWATPLADGAVLVSPIGIFQGGLTGSPALVFGHNESLALSDDEKWLLSMNRKSDIQRLYDLADTRRGYPVLMPTASRKKERSFGNISDWGDHFATNIEKYGQISGFSMTQARMVYVDDRRVYTVPFFPLDRETPVGKTVLYGIPGQWGELDFSRVFEAGMPLKVEKVDAHIERPVMGARLNGNHRLLWHVPESPATEQRLLLKLSFSPDELAEPVWTEFYVQGVSP